MNEHFVRFYENEASLAAQASNFIGAGLESGDACIVVATQPHRDAIARQLRMHGGTVDAADCLMLDAAETLSSLTIDNWPQETAVADLFKKLVDDASQGGSRHVRIFGEMVAVLVEAGNEDAAILLEELWNRLSEPYPISLLCAYPIQTIISGHCRSLIRICAEHTGVALPDSLWTSAYLGAAPLQAAHGTAPMAVEAD
ncbi:MAG TPA: MEDS domain-containing protein [Burkholderiales bacterium]|nr:MEDS domain-containing protein [Burkholderiales bacterium]